MAVGVTLAGAAYRGDVIMIVRLRAAAAAVALTLPLAAHAAVIYDNIPGTPVSGNCAFSTTCAADIGDGDVYAAQLFTLADAVTIESAAFAELDQEQYGTSVNWKFYLADGGGDLPGTLMAEGSSDILSSPSIGTSIGYNVSLNLFDLPSVSLGAGDYYFALQLVSPFHDTYLTAGVSGSGGAQSNDGGAIWSDGYRRNSSIAVALYDTNAGVPEPATWALMIMGFAGAGAMLRRRRLAAA